MRVYLPVTVDLLEQWQQGSSVQVEGYLAASEDEEDELAALESAADDAPAVAVADVADPDGPIEWDRVEALHFDADDSGDLAWFAPSEIAAVVTALRAQ